MSLLATHSHDHYDEISLEYSSDSTAVIAAGVGRNGTAGIVTEYNSTYFILDRVSFGQGFALLELFRGIAFQLTSLPPAGTRVTLLQFMEADYTPHIAITVDSDGVIEAYRGTQSGTLLESSATPVVIDVYYYLETSLFIDPAAGNVTVRLWLDSDTSLDIIDFTGNTQNGGSGDIALIGHGTDGATPVDAIAPAALWDDGYLCDSEGSDFNSLLGNKHIEIHFPDDAGFYTEWVPVPGIPNYANVDESPPDLDDSYNYAPQASPSASPSFRSASSATNSDTINVPAGTVAGDLLFVAIKTTAAGSGVSDIQPNLVQQGFGSNTQIPPMPPEATLPHFHDFSTLDPSLISWMGSVAWKIASDSEPASYTFLDTNGDPLTFDEAVMLCYTDINQAVPVEDGSINAASARDTTITFNAVDAETDNDLIVAFEFTESQTPATPTGYTANYSGSFIKVASKVNASAASVIVPSTTLGAADTWGSDSYSLKANAEIEAGGKDTFSTDETSSESVDAAVVKLCARVDSAGNSVGAVMRQDSTDETSGGVEPSTSYLIYQFPYETAPDSSAWTADKFNESESGYSLDSDVPPVPPEQAVLFEVDAADLDSTYNDGDSITTITETGQFGYVLSLARAIAGDYIPQTFETNVAVINGEDSIQGFTESLSCLPSTRNIGYYNGSTDDDLFLADAFTLVCVFNLSQFDGCWQSGDPVILTRRGKDGFGDIKGWLLTASRTSGGDPGASGKILFYRTNSGGSSIAAVQSANGAILEGTTYLVTVICDGTTMIMRLNGVQVDSEVYTTGLAPAAGSDLWFLNNGDGVTPPQGQTPFIKLWSIELEAADLTAIETELMSRYGI